MSCSASSRTTPPERVEREHMEYIKVSTNYRLKLKELSEKLNALALNTECEDWEHDDILHTVAHDIGQIKMAMRMYTETDCLPFADSFLTE